MIEYKKDGVIIDGEFISVDDIRNKCLTEYVKANNLGVIHFEWPSTRAFDGTTHSFVHDKDKLVRIEELMVNKDLYFGEIAGKHSEICGTLEPDEVTVWGDIDDVVNFLMLNPSGEVCEHSFLDAFIQNYDNCYDEDDEDDFKVNCEYKEWVELLGIE